MLKLREIISKLGDENYTALQKDLEENKAEKFLSLLNLYREGKLSDNEIIEKLQLNVNAFYTLKSRLFDKIQEKLTSELAGSSAGLIQQVTHIPTLLYATSRDVAIAALKKLEKDLLQNDLYNELIPVYGALKKLHYNTPKFFTYSQLYNRHIAYTLALGKASDLLCDFNRKLEEYFISRQPLLIDQIKLIKQELENVYKLNESHQLFLYKSIVDISCAVYLSGCGLSDKDDPVDEIIQKADNIFNSYTQDPSYEYLVNAFNFLGFSYYNQLGLHKNASRYYEKIIHLFPAFLEYDHTVFSYHLLVDLVQFCLREGDTEKLDEFAGYLRSGAAGTDLSVHQKMIIARFLAAVEFSSGHADKTVQVLQQLINEVSFKHYPHCETEVKLFLALNQVMSDKMESAVITMRSVTRKLRESGMSEDYPCVRTWAKLINHLIKNPYGGKKDAGSLIESFVTQNQKQALKLNFFMPDATLLQAFNG